MLFEPEHELRTKSGHLLCDQWITTSKTSPKAHAYLKRLFANRVDCDWIAQNSNRSYKRHLWPFVPKKFIIKFVRGNLLSKYVNEDFGIPVIHVIRNPYDVISSQLRSNFPWLYNLSIFSNQESLVQLIKDRFDFDIRQYPNLSKVEVLCLRWCIENVIPLEVLEPYQGPWTLLRYEDLFSDLQVFMNVCQEYNLDVVPNIEAIYRQPSTKTHSKSTIRHGIASTSVLSDEDRRSVKRLLEVFKTQLYS